MSITLNIPPLIRHIVGERAVNIEGSTIGECLNDFISRFPEARDYLFDQEGQLYDHILILHNGMSTYCEGLVASVNPGDELNLLFMITGG